MTSGNKVSRSDGPRVFYYVNYARLCRFGEKELSIGGSTSKIRFKSEWGREQSLGFFVAFLSLFVTADPQMYQIKSSENKIT